MRYPRTVMLSECLRSRTRRNCHAEAPRSILFTRPGATAEALERRVLMTTPALTITAPLRRASENGLTIRAFTIQRTGDISAPLIFHVAIGGKAKNGVDYGIIGPDATIPAGAASLRM